MFFDLVLTNFFRQFYQFKFFNFLAIFLASYLPYFLVLFFLFFLFFQKQLKRRLEILFFSLLGVFLSFGVFRRIINLIYNRLRPFKILDFEPLIKIEESFSLPSGHSSFFFVLALVIYYFDKKVGIYFLIATILMAIARVYVGVHWFSDVLLGFAISWLSFLIVKVVFQKYFKK